MGANAILLGLDPYGFVDQGKEDFIIRNAMLTRAVEIRRKERDYDNQVIAHHIAEVIGRALGGG